MKKLLILFFLAALIPHAALCDMPKKAQLLSPTQTLNILSELKPHAVVFGTGESEIHTFIDPYCELSQRYLSFIFAQKERMFSKYTFYFYLYELNGKNSSKVITAILSSEFQTTSLKSVMLNHEEILDDDSGEAQKVIETIAGVAAKIGVFKRPYILINGKVKE